LYCIVSIHLYSASRIARQSEALPLQKTQREESSLQRTTRCTWLTPVNKGERVSKEGVGSKVQDQIRSLPRDLSSSFYKLLQTFIFAQAWAGSTPMSSCLEVVLYIFHG